MKRSPVGDSGAVAAAAVGRDGDRDGERAGDLCVWWPLLGRDGEGSTARPPAVRVAAEDLEGLSGANITKETMVLVEYDGER